MLYRKYRPQIFSEVIGQEHIVRTLRGALTSGRLGHAFLFAGPRGTGKTTVARILAKAINCKTRTKEGDACGKCDSCSSVMTGQSLDLVEIDAASNRGIDEIRNLKESASISSLGGGSKVFLIDEVHMLTKDAFNALLKILEEPPSHVIFILATTEPHKILATVMSRVQRFDFKKITHAQIVEKLKSIANSEKVKLGQDALEALAMSSDGAMRDAEVSFSKVIASVPKGETITAQMISDILGLIPVNYYPEFLGYLSKKDVAGATDFIQRIYYSGIDLENFTKEFVEYLRRVMIYRIDPKILSSVGQDPVGEHAKVLEHYAKELDYHLLKKLMYSFADARMAIKSNPIPQLPLEMAVFDVCQP